MDNNTIMQMFLNMMQTMSDSEINTTLEKAKTVLSPNDYKKLEELIKSKRN